MPRFDLECTYCGHRWQATYWSREHIAPVCLNGKCGDKNIKMRQLGDEGTNDMFGYNVKYIKGKKDTY